MKTYFLTVVVAGALLSSCSSAYRTAQTPDDVYFSTGNTVVVAQENRVENRRNAPDEEYGDGYQSYWNDGDDAYLRMKVRSGGRWNGIDDYGYWNGFGYQNGAFFNPHMYSYNYGAFNRYQPMGGFYGYNNPWGFNTWNNHWGASYYGMGGFGFNPWFGNNFGLGLYGNNFYGNNYYGNNFNNGYNYWNKPVTVNRPTNTSQRGSLQGYSNPNLNRSNNNRGQASSNGSLFRSVFGTPGTNSNSSGNNSSNNSTYERPSRTFDTPNSSTNSSGSSSSGSSSSGSSRSSGSSSGGRGGRGG